MSLFPYDAENIGLLLVAVGNAEPVAENACYFLLYGADVGTGFQRFISMAETSRRHRTDGAKSRVDAGHVRIVWLVDGKDGAKEKRYSWLKAAVVGYVYPVRSVSKDRPATVHELNAGRSTRI